MRLSNGADTTLWVYLRAESRADAIGAANAFEERALGLLRRLRPVGQREPPAERCYQAPILFFP